MVEETLKEILTTLIQIKQDQTVPKNIRLKICDTIECLNNSDGNFELKIHKSLQELDELSNDSNIPPYTRAQIWNIVSLLESI